MSAIKSIFSAVTLTVVMTATAFAGQITGFASIDAAVTQDKKVTRVERSLSRDKYELVSTGHNTIYYIVAPSEGSYKTSEMIYTYAASMNEETFATDYATVTVDIIYNNDEGTYSVGAVNVGYKSVL